MKNKKSENARLGQSFCIELLLALHRKFLNKNWCIARSCFNDQMTTAEYLFIFKLTMLCYSFIHLSNANSGCCFSLFNLLRV